MNVDNLISTSVNDCKITLQNSIDQDPYLAAQTCLDLISALSDVEGQITRRNMAASMLVKAGRAITYRIGQGEFQHE